MRRSLGALKDALGKCDGILRKLRAREGLGVVAPPARQGTASSPLQRGLERTSVSLPPSRLHMDPPACDVRSLHAGDLWGPMGTYGCPWGPIGTHGDLCGPMGTYRDLWGPMGWGASTFCTPILTPTPPPLPPSIRSIYDAGCKHTSTQLHTRMATHMSQKHRGRWVTALRHGAAVQATSGASHTFLSPRRNRRVPLSKLSRVALQGRTSSLP